MVKRWIKVSIDDGMFPVERTITLFDVEGKKHQWFIQLHTLNLENEKVAVDVLSQDNERALISIMTSHGWENIIVPKKILELS
jgi:hypothetical protein